jgi:thiol-disulfide isomerase/thioredoxin
MTVSTRVHMPSLGAGTEWLNSEPLGPAELDGQVVLVDFWTLTCINWLRTEPYIRAWSQAYRDDGLVVIGAHTPEFSFEHDVERVRRATKERAIDYPVAADNDYEIWSAFDNRYCPALCFVDADGIIRGDQIEVTSRLPSVLVSEHAGPTAQSCLPQGALPCRAVRASAYYRSSAGISSRRASSTVSILL